MTMMMMVSNAHRSCRYRCQQQQMEQQEEEEQEPRRQEVNRTTTLDTTQAEYLRRLGNAMQVSTLLYQDATDLDRLTAQYDDAELMLSRTVHVDSMHRLVDRITSQMDGGEQTRSYTTTVLVCEVMDAAVQMLDRMILSRVPGVRFHAGDDVCIVYSAFEHVASRTDGDKHYEVWESWKERCGWNIKRIRHLQFAVLLVYPATTFNFVCMFLAQLSGRPLFPPDLVEAMFRDIADEVVHFRRGKECILFAPSTIALALVLRCNADSQDLVNGFIGSDAGVVPDEFFQFEFPFDKNSSHNKHAGLSTQLLNVDLCLVLMDAMQKEREVAAAAL